MVGSLRSRSAFLVLLASVTLAQPAIAFCLKQTVRGTARLTVRVVDLFGKPLANARVDVTASKKKIGTMTQVGNGEYTISNLPYGGYLLRAELSGFSYGLKEIQLAQPDAWVLIGLQVGTIDAPDWLSLSGKVLSSSSQPHALWVKLISVFSGLVLESRVTGSGDFRFGELKGGSYLLVTIRDTEICDSRRIEITSRTPPVIVNVIDDK